MAQSSSGDLRKTPFRITIDDLGLFKEVEESVVELGSRGIPLYASWLVNFLGPSLNYLKKSPLISNGLHFNVLEGRAMVKKSALTNEQGYFVRPWWYFVWADRKLRTHVEMELENQILVAKSWFGNLSHLDSHLHLHSIPWIHDLFEKMAKRFQIPYIRNAYEPYEDSKQIYWKTSLLEIFSKFRKQSELPCYGISCTFKLDAKKCVELLSQGRGREFVFHTCLRMPNIIPEGARFTNLTDMEWRFQEHLQLSLLLDRLRMEMP